MSEKETFEKSRKNRLWIGLLISSLLMIIFFHEYIIPNPSASLNLHFKSNKIGYVNNDEISHMIDLIHCQQEELDLLKQGKIVEDERIVNDKRDDKKDDDKDKDDKDKDEKKDTPLLDQSYIRFLLAVAALIVINMVIIVIVHFYFRIANSSSNYRDVEHKISPF